MSRSVIKANPISRNHLRTIVSSLNSGKLLLIPDILAFKESGK